MAEQPPPAKSPPERTAAEAAAALEELRGLLLAPERAQLAEVRETVYDPKLRADSVSQVLPEAVRQSAGRDGRLGRALAPTVEAALRESIQRNPGPLAEAIFPIIGPAIRKSIAAMFRELTQSFNRTLEHSLSARGWGWRLEAWQTGKSFAEVVLARTLVYRVEQTFLIHNETSVLLAEAHAARTETRDPDQVSAMLAAIQDFMRDSFRTDRRDGLNTVEFGDLLLWLEHGPRATLVAAIRGQVAETFRPIMQTVLEDIHGQFGESLATFGGDIGPFGAVVPELERCLVSEHGRAETSKPVRPGNNTRLWWGLAGLLLTVWAGWRWWESHRWGQFRVELARTPGLVLTGAERDSGQWHYHGLRDPLADSPEELLGRLGRPTNGAVFHLAPFWSLEPELVLRRAAQRLQPPAGVTLHLAGETLRAQGVVSATWVSAARAAAMALPGVTRFDADGVVDPARETFVEARQRVEALSIPFPQGSAITAAAVGPLDQLAVELRQLWAAAAAIRQPVVVELLGHTDRVGTVESNLREGLLRAEAAAAALGARGVRTNLIRLLSRGEADATAGDKPVVTDRRVTVRVLAPDPAPVAP